MIELILDILKKNNIETYALVEENRETSEVFFLKKNLDMTRNKNVKEVRLTIYRDFFKNQIQYRGSATIYLYPEHSEKEIESMILEGYESAGYITNPYFSLPKDNKENVGVIESTLTEHCLIESAIKMGEALLKEDNSKDAFVNSIEVFVERKDIHIINSEACDIQYSKYRVNGEFVVQSTANHNDVEQYQQFHFHSLDTAALQKQCREALHMVKDRAYAQKAPEDLSEYPVILYGPTVGEFLQFYKERTDASMIYPKYSNCYVNLDMQKDARKERLNLNLLPTVPYDTEGIKLQKHAILEDGVVKAIHGNSAYSSYIGVRPLGTYEKIECLNHTMDFEQMKKTPYLLVMNFSDFQMDSLDGHFGGEFRLAYLFDGKETKILTGGTISGNIFDAQKSFIFSNETYQDANYVGPIAVRLG